MADGFKYVFIGGLHRSGTSLLHRVIASHPRASGFRDTGVPEDEGQHLQTVYPPAKVYGGPGKFCFDARSFLDETSELVTEANRRRLLEEWERYWSPDAEWRIEKSPPNLVRGRFLQAMFPGCRLVFIVRHPATVSFATEKWSHSPIPELLRHWAVAHDRALGDLPSLQRASVVRYEDLVAFPDETLCALGEQLGLPEFKVAEAVSKSINDEYLERWSRWRRRHFIQARLLDRRVVELSELFGYSLAPPFTISRSKHPAVLTVGRDH